MFIHYLSLAWRQLVKYRLQSLVSIVSLAIGFACFALAMLWIRYERTYDTQHPDAERLYMVYDKEKLFAPEPLANYLGQNLPEVEEFAGVYPTMKYDNSLIKSGTRISCDNTIYKAACDLWDTELNNPMNAPTLWVKLNYKEGIRIIPNPITVTEAFAMDELGWWGDELYKSKAATNVYTPEQYPAYWELQS